MSKAKLAKAFQSAEARNEKAFVSYIMAGDGGLNALKDQLLYLQEIGVTAAEVGIPFSDPVADGPVIQEAGKRALAEGVTLKRVLSFLEEHKNSFHIPIVLMTYLNPVFQYGIEAFAEDSQKAGVSGVIVPDMPLEEEKEVREALQERELALIRLVTLTSPEDRIAQITDGAEGFIYAVTVKGTTGVRNSYQDDVGTYLGQIKEKSKVPVLAGFGVSSQEQAAELGKHCDGVIVGSKIVDLFHQGQKEKIKELIPQREARTH
ncbi:tryptophan synthase subunit alpha [Bacillus thermotolerans]|uniref:tryptophan synthase subunit alpha n=1 Tax=Bacillus thermotolerans TaxID=1221996 RepID=UPI00057D3A47|nr:tryptophan synthase subunit alpha [Bacillus thermotolerans]KKB35415.1 Tryptophan synthase alpha chain [Bacillus thermotolerans]